jgi:hypothetical protein
VAQVITVEKYFAIVHPHRRRLAQHKNAIVAMVLLAVWLFGPCYTIPFTVSTSDVSYDKISILTMFII